MPKSITAQLLADIQKTVTTTAICVEIVRRDGKTIRITNHDDQIVVGGYVYDHTIPFALGAVDSGSQMATDNVPLTLFADGTTFDLTAFEAGLYDGAECSIFVVDYENPSHGTMTLRRGWFGPIERGQNKVITVTVTGLLKVLDFEVGRIYQPTCDADFGDKRCKIAINFNQTYSQRNRYQAGDWVYHFDSSLLTPLTVVNPGFEDDGTRTRSQAITGWTRAPGSGMIVDTSSNAVAAGDGTYSLYGDTDDTLNDSGFVDFVYQDIDLVSEGVDVDEIDDGQICLLYQIAMAQTTYTLDPLNLKIEQFDSSGDLITAAELGWQFLDAFGVWRDRTLFAPVRPGVRTIRIYIMMRKEDGAITNGAADDVRLYYWNHVTTDPYSSVIHKTSRIVGFSEGDTVYPRNPSFEAGAPVTNALSPTVTGWNTTGSWWSVGSSVGVLSAPHGSYLLVGGDDGGSTEQVWEAFQTISLTTLAQLNLTRVDLGKIVGRFRCVTLFGDDQTHATVKLGFYDESVDLLDEYILISDYTPGSPGIMPMTQPFTVPAGARSVRIDLQVHTPTGSGDGSNVGFDDLSFHFYDADRPVQTDPFAAVATGQALAEGPGAYTVDGFLLWSSSVAHVTWDIVDSVTSNKEFVATTMAGDEGTYETGYVLWLSGHNAGLKTPIRTFNPTSSTVKLYFREPYNITPGDRFLAVRSCQRRFNEDCVAAFNNGINFRGFPHLPGKLTAEEEIGETP